MFDINFNINIKQGIIPLLHYAPPTSVISRTLLECLLQYRRQSNKRMLSSPFHHRVALLFNNHYIITTWTTLHKVIPNVNYPTHLMKM